MAQELRFDGRVAIVTGAGNGLGRAHALLLGKRGCRVVVNDLGGSMHGGGNSSTPADKVVEEIKAAGGDAIANYDSVEDGAKIVQAALDTWKRIDVVVNNAGILRDTSFQKLTQDDWDLVYRVHVLGSFRVSHAAWNHMRDAGYGRIIFTASAAGIYGNFGQANYSMAKLGLVGLSNTLAIEGKKRGVLVNTIAPIAGSRLTETVLPKELTDALKPEYVSPLVAYLAHESCTETGGLFEVGGGFVSKLRWQRTEGKTFKLGKALEPEAIAASWKDITDFDKATYPADITQSMGPVLGNLSSKSKGGNQFIDVDAALGYEFPPLTTSYTERDLALYALGVGAAKDPLDQAELKYVYELNGEGFQALPTYAVVPVINSIIDAAKEGKQAPGLNYGFERILHGEQLTSLSKPLPPHAKLTHKTRIQDIWDKGKNAVVVIATDSYDEKGDAVAHNEISMVVRGAGGWGGDRGPAGDANTPPERAPDATVEQKISEDQALLYRLSGDVNPLHADPGFAKAFGFPRPILHGLCTFGYAARHVIKSFANNDPRFFKSIRARFADSVFPGETLVTEMWKEGNKIIVRAKVKERDKVAISNAAVELHAELPKDKPKAAPAPAAAAPAKAESKPAPAAAPAGLTSRDVFTAIADYIAKNPDLPSQIATAFQFKLKGPDSEWLVDVKNGKGSVTNGSGAADVTLELSDSDFLDMSTGKADPQKLYFGGKLKIAGNVMASQKLMFLKKIDVAGAQAAVAKARAAEGAAVPPTDAVHPTNDDLSTIHSADVFVAIADYIEKNPELPGQINTAFQFKLKSPESEWLVDLKGGKGAVTKGTGTADVTLELTDADFLDMSSGKADPQKLYFGGKLKISGNVMASQKLMFLKKIKMEDAKAAVLKARAAAPAQSAAPAAVAATKESKVPGIFKALGERLAKDPAIAAEVGAVLQFVIKDAGSTWTVDLGSAPGSVKEGAADKATTTFKLTEEDLVALTKGTAASELHQNGHLRVDGEVRPAHKLGFLKGLS